MKNVEAYNNGAPYGLGGVFHWWHDPYRDGSERNAFVSISSSNFYNNNAYVSSGVMRISANTTELVPLVGLELKNCSFRNNYAKSNPSIPNGSCESGAVCK